MASTRRLQIDGEIRACRAELEALGIGGRAALGAGWPDVVGIVDKTINLVKTTLPADASPLIQVVYKGLLFVLSDAKELKTENKDKLKSDKAFSIAQQLARYLEFVPIITKATETDAAVIEAFNGSAAAIAAMAKNYGSAKSKKISDLHKLFHDIGENLKLIPDSIPNAKLLIDIGNALSS
jgi:hypothetical protein